jgi:hypothetical protein
LSEDEICRLITDAGWTPQQRDQYYRPITTERGARVQRLATQDDRLPIVPLTIAGHE